MKSWRQTLRGSEFKIMRLNDAPVCDDVLCQPDAVGKYLVPKLAESLLYRPDVENFIVIHLTTRGKPIGFEVVSSGTLDTILITPALVFKGAMISNAAKIILAHNHPSGDSSPSEADIKVTRDLIKCGQLLKIEVTDHIILGQNRFSSLRELGYFWS